MTDRPDPLATPIRGAVTLTITLFGDNDRIDHALSQELGRRGCVRMLSALRQVG